MKDRKAVNFYRSYYDVAKKIPKEDREPFLMAILDMQFKGVEPKEGELSLMSDLAFTSQKHSLVKQLNGYLNSKKPPTLKVTPRVTHTHTPLANCLPLTPDQVQEKEEEEEKVKEELKRKKEKDNELFNSFWKVYPVKSSKSECVKKFNKLSSEEKKTILATINDFVNYKPFEKYNHPNPLTYINQKRWEDEIPKEVKKIIKPTHKNIAF